MNKCIFSGRLVRAPELRYTQTNKTVCNFSLAITDGFGDRKETNYPDFTAWEKTAEFVAKQQKGTLIEIVSERKERPYVDKDGKKHKGEYFLVSELKVLIYMDEPEEYPTVKTEPEAIPEKSYADMYPDDSELPF